jgi:hypothetical protein
MQIVSRNANKACFRAFGLSFLIWINATVVRSAAAVDYLVDGRFTMREGNESARSSGFGALIDSEIGFQLILYDVRIESGYDPYRLSGSHFRRYFAERAQLKFDGMGAEILNSSAASISPNLESGAYLETQSLLNTFAMSLRTGTLEGGYELNFLGTYGQVDEFEYANDYMEVELLSNCAAASVRSGFEFIFPNYIRVNPLDAPPMGIVAVPSPSCAVWAMCMLLSLRRPNSAVRRSLAQ